MEIPALYSFMSRQRYGVVSSIAANGDPQSALVGIAVTENLEVIFDTVRSSRKYRNLVAHPECSFVIGWQGEQTVQLEGTAIEPTGPDLERFQRRYFSVWPDGQSRMNWPGIVYFSVAPQWIRYSDFEHDPPRIEEMIIGSSSALSTRSRSGA